MFHNDFKAFRKVFQKERKGKGMKAGKGEGGKKGKKGREKGNREGKRVK